LGVLLVLLRLLIQWEWIGGLLIQWEWIGGRARKQIYKDINITKMKVVFDIFCQKNAFSSKEETFWLTKHVKDKQ